MEHSTLCLDLSSDEENSKSAREDRGKENTPPTGYEAPVTRSSASRVEDKKTRKQQPRRRVLKQDEMDDGQRSPLSDLEAEDFFAEGLTKDSTVIVDALPEKAAYTSSSLSQELGQTCFAAPEHKLSHKGDQVLDIPVVDDKGEVTGDVLIFEDFTDEDQENASPVLSSKVVGEKRKRIEV